MNDRFTAALAALQRVWDDWRDTPNATDPEAEGYETLQAVKAALEWRDEP